MKINEKIAKGIMIVGENVTYVKAIRKPNVDCKTIQEVWFKGNVKDLEKFFKRKSFYI